jgi:hypothetical protein
MQSDKELFSSWYPLSHKQLGIFILKFPLHSEQLDFVFTQLPQIELHSWQEFDYKSRNLAYGHEHWGGSSIKSVIYNKLHWVHKFLSEQDLH